MTHQWHSQNRFQGAISHYVKTRSTKMLGERGTGDLNVFGLWGREEFLPDARNEEGDFDSVLPSF